MIDVHRNAERRRHPHGDEYVRIAFGPQAAGAPLVVGLGDLGGLSEIRLPPAGRFAPGPRAAEETVTYVHSGALALEDANGRPAVAYAGEFLCSVLPPGVQDREINASTTAGARVFRISLHRLEAGLGRASERTRFTAAQRRNKICAVASPDARGGSLKTRHDVVVCSSVLDAGRHLAYPLGPGRAVWIHLLGGSAMLGELVVGEGDSVGVCDEPWVSFVARQDSEVLLIDLGVTTPGNVDHHNDADLSL